MIPAALVAAAGLLAAAGPALTEAQAVELALRADAGLSARGHAVAEREALRDGAGALANPELRVENLRSDRLLDRAADGADRADPFERARVGLRWRPPGLGELGARRAVAGAEAARAAADLALDRGSVVARVRALHATVLGLDAQLAVARAVVEERARARGLVARRAGEGAATVVEDGAAEVERLEALARVEGLEARRRHAWGALQGELGLPEDAAPALSAEGAARCGPPPDVPAPALAPAVPPPAADPSRRALAAELGAIDAARSRSGLALVPWPSHVELSYVLPGDASPGYWTLQLGVTLPLLDAGGAERRALAAARSRVEDEERARAAETARALRTARAEQAEQAALARRHREAAEVLAAGLERFQRSDATRGLLEAIELRVRLLAARRAALDAELRCTLGQIEVDRLAGTAAGAG